MHSRNKSQNSSEKVLLSSGELSWNNIHVETRVHSGGAYQYAGFENHLISVHLGAPILLERSDDEGRIYREQIACGDTMIIPAGQPSFWRHADRSHFLNLKLSPSLLDQVAEQMEIKRSAPLLGISPKSFRDPHLEQLGMLLRLEMESGAPHGHLYTETLTNALCQHLLLMHSNRAAINDLVGKRLVSHTSLRQAAAFIADNLAANISLATLADVAAMSPHHFTRSFTQTYGVPPHQYLIRARIERAKQLLRRDDPVLSDIARRVGFADQSHFTRHFKRLVGVTPRTFARGETRKNIL